MRSRGLQVSAQLLDHHVPAKVRHAFERHSKDKQDARGRRNKACTRATRASAYHLFSESPRWRCCSSSDMPLLYRWL